MRVDHKYNSVNLRIDDVCSDDIVELLMKSVIHVTRVGMPIVFSTFDEDGRGGKTQTPLTIYIKLPVTEDDDEPLVLGFDFADLVLDEFESGSDQIARSKVSAALRDLADKLDTIDNK